jgi:DNA polymerase-3 subunit delta'
VTDLLFGKVPGQGNAVAALRAAALRPVHAYLLVGPPGTGKAVAACAFAALLLCPAGGDGTCEVCRRVIAGTHPDVVQVEREGPAISIGAAREVARLAARSPVEGDRKVLVLHDFHLVKDAGPALLKTIEEPAPSTVFVILAEHIPPELVTIASRCVRVDFAPLAPDEVAALLVADGVDQGLAGRLADSTGGRLDRARLLASDSEFEQRMLAWASVPGRLDGTGATAASVADELVALLDSSTGPLQGLQEAERTALDEQNERLVMADAKARRAVRSGPGPGVKEMEERHRRELRRQRTDELRSGLAALAGAYRDRLVERVGQSGRAEQAIESINEVQRLSESLEFNPGELLALQSLLLRLGLIAQRSPVPARSLP